MWESAIEHDAAVLVAIETEVDESANIPSALRGTHDEGLRVGHQDRIGIARVVGRGGFQECTEVARRRKAKSKHEWITRLIRQFIKMPRLEARWIANLGIIDQRRPVPLTSAERPLIVWDHHLRLVFASTHRELRKKSVRKRRAVVSVHGWVGVVAHSGEPATR